MLKTIIFDCDGVMFDSRDTNREYYNFLLQSFGHGKMDDNELEYVHTHNVYDSIEHIFRHYPQQDLDAVHSHRAASSYIPFLRFMRMEPDLRTFLEATHNRYNLAIATNRTNTIVPLLAEFDLTDYFAKVMTADNARRPKPAADPLLEIIDFFGCTIDESIYIGDSEIDEKTAENCNMRLIAFKNSSLNAAYHVNSFTEILTLPPLLATER
ncbi:MAG: HAD family hydrolase [Desulfopila sp.]